MVFDGLEDLANRIDDPDLDVTEDDMLVLKNAGPLTPAGMPEAGYLPIPSKLARAGVKDMVRISDCRMSGTAFGTIVLHVTPEAAAGGPLGLVETGDRIRLSVRERRIDLLVDESDVLARRRAAWRRPPMPGRGWDRIVAEQVLQADEGCDLAVLRPAADLPTVIRRPGPCDRRVGTLRRALCRALLAEGSVVPVVRNPARWAATAPALDARVADLNDAPRSARRPGPRDRASSRLRPCPPRRGGDRGGAAGRDASSSWAARANSPAGRTRMATACWRARPRSSHPAAPA